ncbi:hypothetical protein BDZ94DRAFT_1278663 [Collybia nuda]|uniref:Uncharacterized protein n=1 Tax=Collybia nuda TaxID=64659 RepID=A0A9P5XTK5_9AGAR|nr:hypothetical protein BDZ94DRAFT_1278663 [Collybia nuda]
MGLGYASPFAQGTPSAASTSSSAGAGQSAFLSGGAGGSMFSMGAGGGMDATQQAPVVPGRFPVAGMGANANVNMNVNAQALIDSDTIAMWSNAPTGFELDDWGTYLSNVSDLTQGFHHPLGHYPSGAQHQ